MNKVKLIILLSLFLVSSFILIKYFTSSSSKVTNLMQPKSGVFKNFKTNTDKKSIDLSLLLSGGPGKDVIPAINNPKFIPLTKPKLKDDVLGIYVSFEGEARFYPYNILTWHEIVNDKIGHTHFAITFCPLCGSAIVYNRNIKGEILRLGVSGLLYESNLVMYDDKTESFWSQVRGEAIVGDYTGTKLEVLSMQRISFKELKNKYPKSLVLSEETGFFRDYSFNPYGNYDETDEIYFPISIQDKRFKPKEIMYVLPYKDRSIAFPQIKLKEGKKAIFKVGGETLAAERKGEEIIVRVSNKIHPGYYEMWFSWATQHQKDGLVWEMK